VSRKQKGEQPLTAIEIIGKIDNRQLYGQLTGDDGPIVILDAGLGDTSACWSGILPELAIFSRAFVYDRAGMGRSDPAPTPRSCKDIISDLRYLVTMANLHPPYILVAHSWSGINARYFANEYPDEIAGMVLIDAVHEDKYEQFAKILNEDQTARMWAAVRDPARNDERIDRLVSIKQVHANQHVHNFPLIILTRATDNDPQNQIETRLQSEFLKLSMNSKQYFSKFEDHYILNTEPELVVVAIRQVVESITKKGV
jgi:pimeloyl-ACP methyl ester carboxylesterase